MSAAICLLTIASLVCIPSLIKCQISLGSCDFHKYPVNGCADELGADCDSASMQCRCKSDNWHVVDHTFCFPQLCPKGQYYDHNFQRCENQRKANLNSEENYCKHNYHCKGSHVRCQHVNEWNYRCVCEPGFTYDLTTQDCQRIEGVNGFCKLAVDCDPSRLRNLICVENSCQCAEGHTYNHNIDGCEDNNVIKARDAETRKMIYIFIGVGLFFGTALSLKFGASSVSATQQLLLKRIVESRQQERERQRQLKEQEGQSGEELEEIVLDMDAEPTSKSESTDKSERLIDRETA